MDRTAYQPLMYRSCASILILRVLADSGLVMQLPTCLLASRIGLRLVNRQ